MKLTDRAVTVLRARYAAQTGAKPRNPDSLQRWAAEAQAQAHREEAAEREAVVATLAPPWRPLGHATPEPNDWRGDRAATK